MAQIIVNRTTSHASTETMLGRDVSSELLYKFPIAAPLMTFFDMVAAKTKLVTSQLKYEWPETDFVAQWTSNGGTQLPGFATATLATVVDGTMFVVGDLFAFPNAINSAVKPEICQVVAKPSTNELYLKRGVGSTTIVTVAADASIALLGPAYEEGSSQPSSKMVARVMKSNYIQIFRTPFGFTEEAAVVENFAAPGGQFEQEKAAKGKEHLIAINRAFLFGTASEDLTGGLTGNPIRTTGGLNSVITTNVVDGSTTLTEAKMREFCRTVVNAAGGSESKILLVAPIYADALDYWATSKLQMKISENKYGLKVRELEMGGGHFMVITDISLKDGVAAKNGMSGWAFAVDPDHVKMRYLKGSSAAPDGNTKYDEYTRKEKAGTFAITGEYTSKVGLQVSMETLHGKIYNVSAYS